MSRPKKNLEYFVDIFGEKEGQKQYEQTKKLNRERSRWCVEFY